MFINMDESCKHQGTTKVLFVYMHNNDVTTLF